MDYLHEEEVAQVASGEKGHRVFWFIFAGIIFVILVLIIYLAFIVNHKNISDTKLMEGVALEVGENDAVKFNLDEQEHGMKINFVGYDSVEVTISSNPINLTLKINEVQEVDLDGDGVSDLRIKLIKIVDGKATIAIQRMDKDSCQENWDCSGWSECSKGMQERDCDDINNCGTTFYKPSEEKDCLEMEFIENDSAFGNQTNNLTNLSVNTTANLINNSNVTDNITKPVNLTVLNCGTTSNYSCFINASKTCRLAKWTLSQEMSLSGVISYSTKYFEIKGYSSDDKCIYYEKYLSGGVEYSDALVHDLMEDGYTLDQINEMEESAQSDMAYALSQEKICKFNRAALTELLNKWADGSFSTSDYDNAECYPHSSLDCKLDFTDNTRIAGISISTGSTLQKISISVEGFYDATKVVWSVENSSVIYLTPPTGSVSNIYPLKVGKTTIIVKDTSLDSCLLRIPFEIFENENDSDSLTVCDNDSKCEWCEDETITNCPHDCIGDSNFFSNQSCAYNSDCYNYPNYPLCVLNTCAKPTQALKNFIYQHYPIGNCETTLCNNCQLETYHLTGISYCGFELNFCTECSNDGVFPCREGYVCQKGLCVYSNTTGTDN